MIESDNRADRDWQQLQDLASHSGFWSVSPLQPGSDAAQQFEVHIEGRTIANGGPSAGRMQLADHVDLEIGLTADYPQQAPQCRITSSFFHPNIPADGIVDLRELGIHWQPRVTLDIVVERIWDALRGVVVNLEHPVDIGAGQWFGMQTAVTLPVDQRSLVQSSADNPNIVRYRRHGGQFRELPATDRLVIEDTGQEAASQKPPVHFID